MRNYEVTFIVDPVLSGDEIKATAQSYVDHLEKAGCKIVHVDEMGLLQLAYPIKRRTSGIYYCIEFEVATGELIDKLELTFRRDERIMRFLTVSLDKYGVKYNDDKRNGKIGKVKKKETAAEKAETTKPARSAKPAPKAKVEEAPAPKPEAPAAPAPEAEAEAKVEEETPTTKPVEPVATDEVKSDEE